MAQGSSPKLSGFSMIRNARLMGYPIVESIQSALAICDEFVVGVGQSDDDTKAFLLEHIQDPKLRLFDSTWDTTKTKGGLILSEKTNEALDQCRNDWCLYLQADEVLHERDLVSLQKSLLHAAQNPEIEGLLFKYIHFYGSYDVIATSRRWYRNEVRVVRRSSSARSVGDAQSFRTPKGKLLVQPAKATVYHYGWVKPPAQMGHKSKLLNRWWHGNQRDAEFDHFEYQRQYGLKKFSGSHPAVMRPKVSAQNWSFDPSRNLGDWTIKDLNLWASDALESLTGHRIGEYRPYKLSKSNPK